MVALLTWGYYNSLFSDPAVSQTDFPKAENLADRFAGRN